MEHGSPGGGVSVDVDSDGGAAIALLGGEIDTVTGPAVQGELVELVIAPDVTLVVVDLSEVTFFSSRGLQMLVELDRLAVEHRTEFRLVVGGNRAVSRPLRITGLDTALGVFDRRADAVGAGPRASG